MTRAGSPPRIEVADLTKRYARRLALDGVSCTIEAGTLVGLLGPNGSGKTTLLRVLLGLERPTSGRAEVNGCAMTRLPEPARVVGALLDPGWFHPRRTARAHLRWMAQAARLPATRVAAVLEQTGLTEFADEAVGGFSLGMRQRLGVAGALLGDPAVLVFDEPFNGLDQTATRWLAGFAADRAAGGGIVVMSSHQLAELEPLVDRLLVLGRGRSLFDGPVAAAGGGRAPEVVVQLLDPVRDAERVRRAALAGGLAHRVGADGSWTFPGADLAQVSTTLAAAAVPVRSLDERGTGLREAYERLVAESPLATVPAGPTADHEGAAR
jgi:ABC-2 type transport system ATP-binding protein